MYSARSSVGLPSLLAVSSPATMAELHNKSYDYEIGKTVISNQSRLAVDEAITTQGL